MVYFIQGRITKNIKIGHTKRDDLSGRLQELQSASPDQLNLLLVIEGDKRFEWSLHRRFAKYRLHGEWFSPSSELLQAIADSDFPKPKSLVQRVLRKDKSSSSDEQKGELKKIGLSWFVRWYADYGSRRRMKRLAKVTEFPTRESVEPRGNNSCIPSTKHG